MNKHNIENWDLIAKYFAGECNKQESDELIRWRDANIENEQLFNQVKKDIEIINLNKSMNKVNVESAWEKVRNRIQEDEQKLPLREEKNTRFIMTPVFKYAAAIIIILGIGFFSNKVYQKISGEKITNEYASIAEQGKEIILPDGSKVVLNANSKISYPAKFASAERKVRLEGEAYFDVTKNPEQPFIIDAEDAEVRVLGTSFNVNASIPGSKVEVFVETGLVQLARKNRQDEKVLINPGDVGILYSDQLVKEKNQNENIIAWKTKEIVFREDNLGEVVRVLNNVYKTNIEFKNPDLLNLKYTSTFRNQEIDSILNVICLTFDLKTETKDNTIYLVKHDS
jgi:ferric-dicitrate binding protein FerR (iron transport regulator)